MKRSIGVTSHHEGDALVRVLDVPALKTVQIITGILLDLPDDYLRSSVLAMVQQSLRLVNQQNTRNDPPPPVTPLIRDPDDRDDDTQRLHLASGTTGE